MTNSPKPRKTVKKDETVIPVTPDETVNPPLTAETVEITTNTHNQEEKDMTDKKDEKVETVNPPIDPAMEQIRQLVRPVRDAKVARIAAIDLETAKVAGTLANKVKTATTDIEAEATELGKTLLPDTEVFPAMFAMIGEFAQVHPILGIQVISTMMADLDAKRGDLLETVKGLVNDRLKSTSSGSDEIAALKTERAELTTSIGAMSEVLGETVIVPKAPKLLASGGIAKTRTNKNVLGETDKKVGSYYVVDSAYNGGNAYTFGNDALSYLAYAYGVTTETLKIALGETGLSSLIVPFEQKVTITAEKKGSRANVGDVHTVTIGLDVSTATPETDETDNTDT